MCVFLLKQAISYYITRGSPIFCVFLMLQRQRSGKSGWSNFCTLVGHFSKLFQFAGLKSAKNTYFSPKLRVFSKKKRSSFGIDLQNSCFRPKIRVFSKKKKNLQLESISKIPIFVPKS